jgi:hypothetical protein
MFNKMNYENHTKFLSNDDCYLLNIEISSDELNEDTISDIKHKLQKLNEVTINDNLSKILNCLAYYNNTTKKSMLQQFDFFNFKYYNLPLLQIFNKNGKINRLKNKPQYQDNTFGYVYQLDV